MVKIITCWSIEADFETNKSIIRGYIDKKKVELEPVTYLDVHGLQVEVDGVEYKLGMADQKWVDLTAKIIGSIAFYENVINKN